MTTTTTVPALMLVDDAAEAITPSTYNPGLVSVSVYALYLVPGVRVHDRSGDVVESVEIVTDKYGYEGVEVVMHAGVATFPVDGILTLTVTPEYAAEVVANAI